MLGDEVRTRSIHRSGHTRLPRYFAAGREGLLVTLAISVLTECASRWRASAHLYTVEFLGRELFGPERSA